MLGIDKPCLVLHSASMIRKLYTRFILTIYEIFIDSQVRPTHLMGTLLRQTNVVRTCSGLPAFVIQKLKPVVSYRI